MILKLRYLGEESDNTTYVTLSVNAIAGDNLDVRSWRKDYWERLKGIGADLATQPDLPKRLLGALLLDHVKESLEKDGRSFCGRYLDEPKLLKSWLLRMQAASESPNHLFRELEDIFPEIVPDVSLWTDGTVNPENKDGGLYEGDIDVDFCRGVWVSGKKLPEESK